MAKINERQAIKEGKVIMEPPPAKTLFKPGIKLKPSGSRGSSMN